MTVLPYFQTINNEFKRMKKNLIIVLVVLAVVLVVPAILVLMQYNGIVTAEENVDGE